MDATWWWLVLAVIAIIVLLCRQYINSAKAPPTSLRCNHCSRLARQIRALHLGIIATLLTALIVGIWIGQITSRGGTAQPRTLATQVPAAPAHATPTGAARPRPAGTALGR